MSKKEVLTKRMFVASEMMAAGEWPKDTLREDVIDEISLSLGIDGDGCKWEFSVKLVRLGRTTAMKVEIFSDAWKAFGEAPEIFRVMNVIGGSNSIGQDDARLWPLLLDALEEAGWKRVKPEPKKEPESKVCTACGK